MRRKNTLPTALLPSAQAAELSEGSDDLDILLEEELAEPDFRAAYEDAHTRSTLLRHLLEARRLGTLTQGAVAERMGTTQSAISELEGGVADPRLSTLQRYARAVGCRIAAWVAPADASGDEAFAAFVSHEATYLVGPSTSVPGQLTRIVNGQRLSLQIVGVAIPTQIDLPTLYFAGRIQPSQLSASSIIPTVNFAMTEGGSEETGQNVHILDRRATA